MAYTCFTVWAKFNERCIESKRDWVESLIEGETGGQRQPVFLFLYFESSKNRKQS